MLFALVTDHVYSIVFLVLSLLLCLNYLIGASYCCSYIGSIRMHVSRFSVTSVSGRVSVVHSCFVMFLPCCCCFLYYWHISRMPYTFSVAFAMQCYASVVYASSCVCLSIHPSVCHKPVFYRNDWTNRAGFWHGGFLPPIPHCVVRKFCYFWK